MAGELVALVPPRVVLFSPLAADGFVGQLGFGELGGAGVILGGPRRRQLDVLFVAFAHRSAGLD